MIISRLFVALAAVAFSIGSASAQQSARPPVGGKSVQHTCEINGCGPRGFFNAVVPNSLGSCQFKAACDAHDLCYSECMDCHPNSASPLCEGLPNKIKRRNACDTVFDQRLQAANTHDPVCRIAASAYAATVRAMGDSYFRSVGAGDPNGEQFKRVFDEEFKKRNNGQPPK